MYQQLNFTTHLLSKCCYYPDFTDEDTGVQRDKGTCQVPIELKWQSRDSDSSDWSPEALYSVTFISLVYIFYWRVIYWRSSMYHKLYLTLDVLQKNSITMNLLHRMKKEAWQNILDFRQNQGSLCLHQPWVTVDSVFSLMFWALVFFPLTSCLAGADIFFWWHPAMFSCSSPEGSCFHF